MLMNLFILSRRRTLLSNNISLKEAEPLIQEIISSDSPVTLVASGSSMEPLIHDNTDTVTLSRPSGKLKKGDVPFYKRDNGQLVLHRIIGEDENGYIICGDNQWVKEYGVKDNQIIAVLTCVGKGNKKYDINGFYCKAYKFFLPVIRWYRRIKFSIYIRIKRSK